jgi:regulator of sirC expression with transglutaminase-like and TPR domain
VWIASRELFRHLLGLDPLPLFDAALLVGETEHEVDAERAKLEMARLEAGVRAACEGLGPEREARLHRVLHHVYRTEGYRGDEADYYQPANSFLDRVIERRRGIPITLALVLQRACAAADLPTHGVAFPGHFLVACEIRPDGTHIVVDPFTGKPQRERDLVALHERTQQAPPADLPRLLQPSDPKATLARILRNLSNAFARRGDAQGQARADDLLALAEAKPLPLAPAVDDRFRSN